MPGCFSRAQITASLGAAGVGAVMLGVATAFCPAGWPVTIAGAAALLAALPARWPAAGTAAAVAALVTSGIGIAAGSLPLPAAAAEGVLILAYLLALDCAETRLTGGMLRWAGARVPALAAGSAAAALIAVAAGTAFPSALWLTVIGPAAAGAALLAAGPRRELRIRAGNYMTPPLENVHLARVEGCAIPHSRQALPK
jgi:hypothetical protein